LQYSLNFNKQSFKQTVSQILQKSQLPTNSLDWKCDRMDPRIDIVKILAKK
jgi:uncharacterized membrane protein YfcA